MLLLLSRFSRVRLCATPQTAAHQAPPSLGFSRQEHWSGLPFPSPVRESEKWKWSRSVVSDSSRPHGPQPTRLLLPWDFPGKSPGVGCHCLLQVFVWVASKLLCTKESCIYIAFFFSNRIIFTTAFSPQVFLTLPALIWTLVCTSWSKQYQKGDQGYTDKSSTWPQ